MPVALFDPDLMSTWCSEYQYAFASHVVVNSGRWILCNAIILSLSKRSGGGRARASCDVRAVRILPKTQESSANY